MKCWFLHLYWSAAMNVSVARLDRRKAFQAASEQNRDSSARMFRPTKSIVVAAETGSSTCFRARHSMRYWYSTSGCAHLAISFSTLKWSWSCLFVVRWQVSLIYWRLIVISSNCIFSSWSASQKQSQSAYLVSSSSSSELESDINPCPSWSSCCYSTVFPSSAWYFASLAIRSFSFFCLTLSFLLRYSSVTYLHGLQIVVCGTSSWM